MQRGVWYVGCSKVLKFFGVCVTMASELLLELLVPCVSFAHCIPAAWSADALQATYPDGSSRIRGMLPSHTGMQAAVQACNAERALRQQAEAKSNEAQADSERRAVSFHSAVRSAVAQAQGELEQERSDHAMQVQPLPSVAATPFQCDGPELLWKEAQTRVRCRLQT
jgi:hypothetical protein